MEVINVAFEDIFSVSIKDSRAHTLANDIIVYDHEFLSSTEVFCPDEMPPVRLDAMAFFLCSYGELSLRVDYQTHRLTKGMVLLLDNRHILETISISNSYEGYTLIVSREFLLSFIESAPDVRKLITKGTPAEPMTKLEDDELRRLVDIILRVKRHVQNTEHTFQSYMVRMEVNSFILELADIFLKKTADGTIFQRKEGRKEDILQKFMQLVLTYCRKEHEVAFYAGKLHMTPGNLSRVMTNSTGKSPSKWLNEALVADAKILLRKPDTNIQQIAEMLHFADQSSFGKFFKKHMGVTPMEFRGNVQGGK